jgi:large subunit ribosomal protein L18
MNQLKIKRKRRLLQRRRWRIRKKVAGTATRPRLSVRFTNKHIIAQLIDDEEGRTLVAASTLEKDLREAKLSANVESARQIGVKIAEKAKGAGIDSAVFDRNGRRYHGAVKSFAEAAREGGLQF